MGAPKGNKYAVGNEGGRPTTYDPIYVSRVYEYLTWCEKNPVILEETTETVSEKPMESKTVTTRKASTRVPSIAGFAVWCRIPSTTIRTWAAANKEFTLALMELADKQERILVEGGRANEGNSRFASFMLSAKHDYREKSETDVTSGGMPITIVSYAATDIIKPDAKPRDSV